VFYVAIKDEVSGKRLVHNHFH